MKKFHIFTILTMIFILLLSLTLFSYPLTIIDDLGRAVTFEKAPDRVVCAAPLVTSYLVKLGLEKKIVGVTNFDTYYTKAERIGNLVPLNVEKILMLKPDIVFTFGGFQASEVEKLEKAGLKAFVINPRNFDDIFRTLRIMGIIFDVSEKSEKIMSKLKENLLTIAKKAYKVPLDKRPKVFYASIYPGSKEIWTCGQGSFLNEAIILAGGVNIASGFTGPNGWLTVNPEFVLKNDPDIVLVPYFVESNKAKVVRNFKNIEFFKDLKAVKNDNIFAVDGNVASTPGPELVGFVEILHKIFYGSE